jgi:hypothetical protein
MPAIKFPRLGSEEEPEPQIKPFSAPTQGPELRSISPERKASSLQEGVHFRFPTYGEMQESTISAKAKKVGVDLGGRRIIKKMIERMVRAIMTSAGKSNPYLHAALTGVTIAGYFGAKERKPPLETITDMPKEAAFWAAFPLAGQTFKAAGKGIMKGATKAATSPMGTAIKGAKNRFLSIPVVPKLFEEKTGGRTIKQLFIPAEERMPKIASQMFRKTQISESLIRQARAQLADSMQHLELPERRLLMDMFRTGRFKMGERFTNAYLNMPVKSRQRVTETLSKLDDWLSTTTEKNPAREEIRQLQFRHYLSTIFDRQLETTGRSMITRHFDDVARMLASEKPFNPKLMQKSLKGIIADPTTHPEARAIAADLHNLTANSLDTLPKAVIDAEQSVLFSKIKSIPGYVTDKAKPGFVASKHPSFKGLHVLEDIEDGLTGLRFLPGFAHTLMNRVLLGPWKLGKVVLRVPTHFRNMFSNMILNDWGGLPFYRQDMYYKAARELRHQGKHAKDFQKVTGFATTFSQVETAHLPYALRHDSSWLQMSEFYLNKLAKPFARAYQMEETWAKLAKYMYNIEKGMPKVKAAEDAVKWTFNYGEVTPFVRTLRATVMPFATWQTKVIPLFLETAAKHPLRLAKWALLPTMLTHLSLKNHRISDNEWSSLREQMPEWMSSSMMALLPFRDSDSRLNVLNFTWMIPGFGDFAELGTNNPMASIVQHPVFTWAAQIYSNKRHYGAPIWYEWEPNEVKAWRVFTHGWLQFMPSLFGQDIKAAYESISGKEGALTPEMFVASQFGMRAHPIDKQRIKATSRAMRRRRSGEIRSRLKKKLREVKDPAKRKKIVEEYGKYLQENE